MRLFSIILFFLLWSATSIAQDTLITMAGYEIPCEITNKEGYKVEFKIEKRKGKKKDRSMHKSEIFSLIQNGEEEVLYAPDPILGDDLSVQEMRIFIAGERDARKYYDARPTFWVGFGASMAGAIFASGALLATLTLPVLYPLAQLIPVIKIKEKYISDPNHRYNEVYAAGFESVARSKKVLGGLKGAFLGALTGVLIVAIIAPDEL
jgi:hypothetical protein